jgi:hypothetical protein
MTFSTLSVKTGTTNERKSSDTSATSSPRRNAGAVIIMLEMPDARQAVYSLSADRRP